MNNPNENIENIKLTFVGLDADKGVIDVKDLTRALEGWREYWEVTHSSFFNKELSTKPVPIELRPKIRAIGLKHSSFDFIGQIIIPIGLMVSYDIFKSLWKWRKAFLKEHINNKKGFIPKEEAIENVKKLAQTFDIQTGSTHDAVRFVDLADEALNFLVEPINRSAKKIIIKSTSSKQPLSLTSSDKLALRSGYQIDGVSSRGLERFSVKFIRIHTETGNAMITFDNPGGIHQIGHKYSTIIDPTVKRPKNAYTRALYEGSSIEVWGRKIFNRINNKFHHWEISKDLPSENNPLFDKNN